MVVVDLPDEIVATMIAVLAAEAKEAKRVEARAKARSARRRSS
jgi:hypothetical protein